MLKQTKKFMIDKKFIYAPFPSSISAYFTEEFEALVAVFQLIEAYLTKIKTRARLIEALHKKRL